MLKNITYDDTQWQLVPKETDRAMDDAAEQYYIDTKNKMKGQWWWNRLYQAYLSAAPTPPARPAERKPQDVLGRTVSYWRKWIGPKPSIYLNSFEGQEPNVCDVNMRGLIHNLLDSIEANGIKGES